MAKKVLITGGLGYIGSHVAVLFIEAHYDVVLVDDLSNSTLSVLKSIEEITGHSPPFIQGDISKKEVTESIFSTHQFDAIIHLAAKKFVNESVLYPLLYYRVNVNSTLNILEGMEKYGIKILLFSSSCTVYGQPESLPVTEKTPLAKSENPYGNSKLIGENMIEHFAKVNPNHQFVSIRIFNPVGAHKSGKIADKPIGIPQNLFPFITQTAIGKREKLSIFGKNYHTPDGTALRDFIHIEDLAQAFLQSLQAKHLANHVILNIGSGIGYSVLEVVNTFIKISGINLPYTFEKKREGDIEKIYADITLAKKWLNWKPQYDLDDMLESAWRWEQNNKKN